MSDLKNQATLSKEKTNHAQSADKATFWLLTKAENTVVSANTQNLSNNFILQ